MAMAKDSYQCDADASKQKGRMNESFLGYVPKRKGGWH